MEFNRISLSDAERLLAAIWCILEEHDLATPLMRVRSARGALDIALTFASAKDHALAMANFADALAEVAPSDMRALVDASNQQDARDRIKRWRQRAEELRTAADQFLEPSARESPRRAAGNCEQMADRAEALLDRKREPPTEGAG